MTQPSVERPYMPDYVVAAPGWEGLPWSWASERLVPCRNYWLATATADGRPHSMPVWGVWDEAESRFGFSCAPRARKARNLADNPRMVITGEDTVECVSVEGSATRVRDEDRFGVWVDRYLAKYVPEAPALSAEFLQANLMFEFEPDRAFGIIERDEEFSRRATRWQFETSG